MKQYTKQSLIKEFKKINKVGWIENKRHGNQGGVGNTLEDLLGIDENNLPLPNAAEWELKTRKLKSTSLVTLFHVEPSPRAMKLVPSLLLLKYGWKHQEAGIKYYAKEMSFRQTIHGLTPSDRGFMVKIDRINKKVLISFDNKVVSERHKGWLKSVKDRIGLSELNPQPYWGFDDLSSKVGTKLLNCFFVEAETKRIDGKEHYFYNHVTMLTKFSFDNFLKQLELGNVLVDFDARTGHNHGTKFRMKDKFLPALYKTTTKIL